ncbi:SMP-30/gluconolactonase/LRE family protein [Sphingomonas sp. LT1P40]|uniref:SMP-30/gluconolactonase/LRE family protein n=1 Tax=Alteristakelama amylovorans TaxID=3096166 RepID=UPI002FC8A3D8
MTMIPEPVAFPSASLGEGPVWDAARQCLWFVDIKQRRLFRFDPASMTLDHWCAPEEIGWALPADDGRLLCGLQDGLHWFDPASGEFAAWLAIEPDMPGNRLNDACSDASGAVWFGSMDNACVAATGSFYRLSRGRVERAGPGPFAITNGPAISPDGATIYFTDTGEREIWSARLGDDGLPEAPRLLVGFSDDMGLPDGSITDAAGNVWVGCYAGWAARCFNPAGEEIAKVEFPTANITKLAFGGPDFATLYATSAHQEMSAEARAAQPLAGALFAFRPEVGGHPLARVRTA